ncbi:MULTISPECIES: thioredoxin family protein [Flavobacteriaceae]|uniref:Thioredoxin n=1 Tax=Flagellimonas alvinocaridis TaxID=2530200 RepID=A0A4S8RG54_9FLAO|nr:MULTISPECIES: thioredoxin family protein [Allomuricauda]MDC6363947.1 thioredoxin family protein [Muricauda sp. SP22]THV57288.1 thioredoxin [Allomuricauda alvinocaridis]
MKSIIFTVLLMLCTGRGLSQAYHQEIILENGNRFLIGEINLKNLEALPYQSWYLQGYQNYTVDPTLVHLFRKKLKDYNVTLFLGTWCGDSKREVPRFIKILEAAKFPMDQLKIIALDRRKEHYKKSPTGEEKGLNIIKVPTMIFFKNGKEVNRIVERPIENLEEDIAQIVLNKAYIPNYAH